jgi:DNA-directed RNA polymerase specialized sigma24 family protein
MNADERAMIVIATLSDREQEALDRLYIEGHEPARICSEMRLTLDQFETVRRSAMSHFLRLGTSTWAELPARLPFCLN